jgi:mono/diheme cytochrome c family protein
MAVALIMLAVPAAHAAPQTYTLPDETAVLKPGPQPGYEIAESACAACHSADYINYQPPGMGEKFWQAEVGKMVKVYHAAIDEADAKAIAAYLAANY